MYGIDSIPYNIILNKYYSNYILSEVNKLPFQEQIQKRTTVSLDNQVYQQLCKRGHFGETFSQLLKRLLDELDSLDRGVTKS
jgi:S-adenosylmethionine synthetase